MLEHAACCEQIDIVRCESAHDLMVYVYDETGACHPILIELQDDIGFDREWIVEQIWPRLTAEMVH